MKKHIFIFSALMLLAFAIVSSCKKDPDPINNGQNNEQPTDTIPNGGNDTIPVVPEGIRFGDTSGMIVTTYNTIMEYDESWLPFFLDLNGDGRDDISIETFYDGPLAIGEFQELTLYCLNEKTEILGDSVVKETYSHRDTTIITNNGWTNTQYNYTFSTCDKVDETDYVGSTKVFELKASDLNNPLSLNDHFQSAVVKLFRETIAYEWMDDLNEEEQYVVHSYNKYIYDCWNFPTDEEKYIGFKLITNGEPRLGWLKIKLCPTWGGRVVDTQLIETAIQE